MWRRSPVVYSTRKRKQSRGFTPMGSAPLTAVFTQDALIAMMRAGMSNCTVRTVSDPTDTSLSVDRRPVE